MVVAVRTLRHVVRVALLAVRVLILAVVLGSVLALVALFHESGHAAQTGRVIEESCASVASVNALIAVQGGTERVQSGVNAGQVFVQEVTRVLACLAEQVVVLTTSRAVLVYIAAHQTGVNCCYVANT